MGNRKLVHNTHGVAWLGIPVAYWVLAGIITTVAAVGAYSYFQEPDVTYNISEGGLFSLAGLEIGGMELVAIIIGIVFVIAFVYMSMGKKKR